MIKNKSNKKVLISILLVVMMALISINTRSMAEYQDPTEPPGTANSGSTASTAAQTVEEETQPTLSDNPIKQEEEKKLTKSSMTSPIDDPNAYKTTVENSPVTAGMVAIIVKWIRNIGVIVAVVALTIIGFKYMLAGAADEKAQYKETLVPVVIGIVMLLGGILLVSSIVSLVE